MSNSKKFKMNSPKRSKHPIFFFKLFSSTIIQRKFQIEIKFKKQSSKMKYIF